MGLTGEGVPWPVVVVTEIMAFAASGTVKEPSVALTATSGMRTKYAVSVVCQTCSTAGRAWPGRRPPMIKSAEAAAPPAVSIVMENSRTAPGV